MEEAVYPAQDIGWQSSTCSSKTALKVSAWHCNYKPLRKASKRPWSGLGIDGTSYGMLFVGSSTGESVGICANWGIRVGYTAASYVD